MGRFTAPERNKWRPVLVSRWEPAARSAFHHLRLLLKGEHMSRLRNLALRTAFIVAAAGINSTHATASPSAVVDAFNDFLPSYTAVPHDEAAHPSGGVG
jgi:hypothetical protein